MNFGYPKTLARKSIVGEALGASTRAGQTTRQSTDGLARPNYFELDSKSLTAHITCSQQMLVEDTKGKLFLALFGRTSALHAVSSIQ